MCSRLIDMLLVFALVACLGEGPEPFFHAQPDVFQPYDALIDGDCTEDRLVAPFAQIMETEGFFVTPRPDLLGQFLDLTAVSAVVTEHEMPPEGAEANFYRSNVECSHYQLGDSSVSLYGEGEFEAMATGALDMDHPLIYGLALALHAAKGDSIGCDLARRFVEGTHLTLEEELSAPTSPTEQAKALQAYLYFSHFFRVARDASLLERAELVRFPGGEVVVPDTLTLALLMDIDAATRLGLAVDVNAVQATLDQSWVGTHHEITDCADGDGRCHIKAFQLLALAEISSEVLDEDRMLTMASYLLGRADESGAFGHPADFGLDTNALWEEPTCDWICSPIHWAVVAALNTFLTRLEHRLGDVEAEMALWSGEG
jgi:hypothetical protein